MIVWDPVTMEKLATLGPKVGEDFFERGIVAARFSPDGRMVVAIGGDDHHLMGVFDWRRGTLLAKANAQNGAPPQVYDIAWVPFGAGDGFIPSTPRETRRPASRAASGMSGGRSERSIVGGEGGEDGGEGGGSPQGRS